MFLACPHFPGSPYHVRYTLPRYLYPPEIRKNHTIIPPSARGGEVGKRGRGDSMNKISNPASVIDMQSIKFKVH